MGERGNVYIYMEGEGDLVRQTRLESVLGFNSTYLILFLILDELETSFYS